MSSYDSYAFLVAKSNSIRGFVRPSFRRSVCGSVGPSVGHAFLENREFNKIHGYSQLLAGWRSCFFNHLILFWRMPFTVIPPMTIRMTRMGSQVGKRLLVRSEAIRDDASPPPPGFFSNPDGDSPAADIHEGGIISLNLSFKSAYWTS